MSNKRDAGLITGCIGLLICFIALITKSVPGAIVGAAFLVCAEISTIAAEIGKAKEDK